MSLGEDLNKEKNIYMKEKHRNRRRTSIFKIITKNEGNAKTGVILG